VFGLVVRFELKDDAAAAGFDALVADTAPKIESEEPGTLKYIVHSVDGAPLSRVFYELYRDRAAFEDHEQQPHVKRFLAAREQFLKSHRVEFFASASGKGLADN